RWDNTEEFFAILLTNVYRSECGRSGLRGDHSLDSCPGQRKDVNKCIAPMAPGLADPAAFYQHFKLQMEKLFAPMAALGREIAVHVDCASNPLYEYGKWHWGLGQKVHATAARP